MTSFTSTWSVTAVVHAIWYKHCILKSRFLSNIFFLQTANTWFPYDIIQTLFKRFLFQKIQNSIASTSFCIKQKTKYGRRKLLHNHLISNCWTKTIYHLYNIQLFNNLFLSCWINCRQSISDAKWRVWNAVQYPPSTSGYSYQTKESSTACKWTCYFKDRLINNYR